MNVTRPGPCDVCSACWVTHLGLPETIGMSDEFLAEICRCSYCGAYWEVGAFSNPKVISREQARRELPGLDMLELLVRIDFPEPPQLP